MTLVGYYSVTSGYSIIDPSVPVVMCFLSRRLDVNFGQSLQCNNCSLAKLTPAELVRKHEEAEVHIIKYLKAMIIGHFEIHQGTGAVSNFN